MAGWYELNKSSDGQFRFSLKNDGGDTLLVSEGYKAKASAESGIAAVRANCGDDARYEKKTAAGGKAFFNLKAANHQVVGTSPMFATDAARDAAIASAKSCGASTTVRDNA